MEFTLFYSGPLHGRVHAKPPHTQSIRRVFHKQLENLWKSDRLAELSEWHIRIPPKTDQHGRESGVNLIEQFGRFQFASLISHKLGVAAQLEITLLRRERPGKVLQRGDIDNQVKTLLDALSKPQKLNQLPEHDVPAADEVPFHCLLQDDALVTGLSVHTSQLLTPSTDGDFSHVVALIRVRLAVTRPVMANMSFL